MAYRETTREDILKRPSYWLTRIQTGLFNLLESYMTSKEMNRSQLAEHLGVTKGYVSQVLNGDADHRLSKIIELSMAIGKVPQIEFVDIDEVIRKDNEPAFVPEVKIRRKISNHVPFSFERDKTSSQSIAKFSTEISLATLISSAGGAGSEKVGEISEGTIPTAA